jgi:dolichol-phosphate mannosyltransferase
VWLPILPLVANAVATSTGMVSSGWLERFSVRAWKPTVVCLLLIYGGFMYYLLVGAPGLPPALALKVPVAWKEAGVQLAALEERIESETGKRPLVAGMDQYQISAQLAFYIPDPYAQNRISGRHLFGRNSLMWNHWYPASGASGKTIIVVSDHTDNLSDGRLAKYFESIGPVCSMDIEINRRPAARLYYRVGYGYKGTGS